MSERAPMLRGARIEIDAQVLSDPRSAEHIYALLQIRAEQDAERSTGATCAHCGASIEPQAARIVRRIREELEQDADAELADRPTTTEQESRQ